MIPPAAHTIRNIFSKLQKELIFKIIIDGVKTLAFIFLLKP